MKYGLATIARKASCQLIAVFCFVRINKSNFSAPSLPCFANDLQRRLKIPLGKWVVANLSLRKNWTESECSYTSEGMNISIALGW